MSHWTSLRTRTWTYTRSECPTGPVWEHVHGHTHVLNVPLDQSENTYMDIHTFWMSHWTSLSTRACTYTHSECPLTVPLDQSEHTYMDKYTFWISFYTNLRALTCCKYTYRMSHFACLRTHTWIYTFWMQFSECPSGPDSECEHVHTHIPNDPLDHPENTYTRSECPAGPLLYRYVLSVPLDNF